MKKLILALVTTIALSGLATPAQAYPYRAFGWRAGYPAYSYGYGPAYRPYRAWNYGNYGYGNGYPSNYGYGNGYYGPRYGVGYRANGFYSAGYAPYGAYYRGWGW